MLEHSGTILDLARLIMQVPQTYQSFREIVLGGQMANAIKDIGEAHVQAAHRAFLHANHSRDPNREIASAITSLREAYEICNNSKNKYKNRDKYQIALLIAICYIVLKDKQLSYKFIVLCGEDFDSFRAKKPFWRGSKLYEEEEAILLGVIEQWKVVYQRFLW